MWAFHPLDYIAKSQYVFSQVSDSSPTNTNGVQDVFLNANFIWGFVGALAFLVPMVTGVAYWLKRSVNSSTTEFIKKQTETYEKNKQETRQQIQDHQTSVTNQISSVNNNVNEKFNASKESIIEIKKIIEDIDDKLDKSRDANTENRIRLNDVERRISNLERNGGGNSALGGFGSGGAPHH